MLAQITFLPERDSSTSSSFALITWICFLKLIDQSQFNRRARALRHLVEQLRRYLDHPERFGNRQTCYLMDTKPVPVLSYKRTKSTVISGKLVMVSVSVAISVFWLQLVAISTMRAFPCYISGSSQSDERLAAETIIDLKFPVCDLFTDKVS